PAPKVEVTVWSADKTRQAVFQPYSSPKFQPGFPPKFQSTEIVIRDAATNRAISTFKEHTLPVRSVVVSPNGRFVVSTAAIRFSPGIGEMPYMTFVWEVITGEKRLSIGGSAMVSSNNRYLVFSETVKGQTNSRPLKILDFNDLTEVYVENNWDRNV